MTLMLDREAYCDAALRAEHVRGRRKDSRRRLLRRERKRTA